MKFTQFNVVLYKTKPAIITGFEGDKIEISLKGEKTDETKKVREKDVEFLHEGPVKTIKALYNAKAPVVDFSEAAEFFYPETSTFHDVAELLWGAFPADQCWDIWKAIESSTWCVCTGADQPISFRTREETEEIINKENAKKDEQALRDAFIARLKATLAGKEGGIDLSGDAKNLQDVEALALGNSDKSRTLKDASLPVNPQSAHRVLLACGYWPLEKNPFPARHGKSLGTSTVPVEPPTDEASRLDLTALDAWAIDNAWSTDPDDAVSFDGSFLWVHIADPAATVTPDSPADLDARNRGSTLYIPEGAARMLNDKALEYYALGLTEFSNALSFKIALEDSGAIDTVEIVRTRVRVTRLTYAEASARKTEPSLAPLFAIAERNIRRRMEAGAVSIELPEIHIAVSKTPENGYSISIDPIKKEEAADMVREMMLLAGEAAARFAFKHQIPFQYVSQEDPQLPKDIPEGLAGEYRKRRSMKSRKVGTIPADHAGLGLGMYSQVTSPLRRYGDLVAHQQLHLFIDGKKLMDTDDMLERIAAGDAAARECSLAERESNLHWILCKLAKENDWRGEAVLVENSVKDSVILIPSLGQEARMKLPSDTPLNTVFTVRAGNINVTEQTVSFVPA